MKKSISFILVLALILSVFALIGGKNEETKDETLSVCVVVSATFGDKSFNDSAKEGADQLVADKGITLKTIECKNEKIKQKLMDAAESSKVVVAVGWECYEVEEVAPEYPDTKFIWVDNVAESVSEIPNLLCITYAQNEGSFLAGYVAAKSSETGIIGVVGGDDSVVINDFIAGYKDGARYAKKDIKVETIYAEGFENPKNGKECALTLADKGADVIFNVAGNTGNGIFEAARELGFYAIGVDSDQKLTNPKYDEVILCSMKKDIGMSIYDTVVAYMDDGVWEGGRELKTDMATGYISIAYGDENSKQLVSEDLKAKVANIASKIVDGKIHVDSAK